MTEEERMFVEASRKALELSEVLESLKKEVSEYMVNNRNLEELNAGLHQLIQKFGAAAENLDNLLNALDSGIKNMEDAVSTFDYLTKLLDNRFEGIIKNLAEIRASMEEMRRSLESSVNSTEKTLAELKKEFDQSKKKLNRKISWTLALLLPSLILIAGAVVLLLYPL